MYLPDRRSQGSLLTSQVLNISVQDNPAKFGDSYNFDITFECLEQLSKGLDPPSSSVYAVSFVDGVC